MSKKVYFSQDGGVDDIISLFLLLQMDDVDLIGVGVMGADSYLQPAAEASRKVIDRFGHGKKLEVAYSNARAVHPFPTKWRLDAYSENSLPILNESGEIKTPKAPLAADDDLIEKLMNSNEPVTLLFTGPLSDLASALKKKPEIEDKIAELMWMGGTFQERGNVAEPDATERRNGTLFGIPKPFQPFFQAASKSRWSRSKARTMFLSRRPCACHGPKIAVTPASILSVTAMPSSLNSACLKRTQPTSCGTF